jgi:Ribonuclease G/E
MTTVRIRGIYATALTEFLSSEHDIVQASEPIQARFDESFPDVPATVTIETSDNRQGVSVSGDREAVESIASLLRRVGIDTLAWTDPAPTGAIFVGHVTGTLSGGAVVDLGDCEEMRASENEGYLPYSNTEEYVDEGDSVRVQVDEAVPPWSDDRPVLTTEVTVSNGFARLIRGGTEGNTGGSIDFVDVLASEPREGWGLRWNDPTDTSFDALGDALTDLNAIAEQVDSVFQSDSEDSDEPERLTKTEKTTWVWFGRESRFALDEQRRSVTATMTGHHRIKAGTQSASGAVDFVEAICEPNANAQFPFDVTTRQFGPQNGDRVAIGHGKPDGRCIVLGRGEVTNYDPDGTITLERQMSPGGTYDALGVERRAGDIAITKLKEGRWWYPTIYHGSNGERRGIYVNICTPVELFPDTARYVDLHVDVVKHADGTTERVDDDELDIAVERGDVSESLAEKARSVAAAIEQAL